MPSDSIAGFLDRAQASRVLFPEQVEQLIRQPDIPQSDLAALCTYLLARGVLTKFQADAIRDGRSGDLSFAGYPLIDELGPCPGGTAYRALHPSLRTPLVLRKFVAGAFAPADTAEAVVQRARAIGTIAHPSLQPVVDAGVYDGRAYAVLDQPADAADLGSLLREVGGAMPGFLAAEYGWAVASALRAIHERGGWHGEVRPGLLVVAPVVTKAKEGGPARRRPAPNATVKLTETGLIPMSRSAAVDPPGPDALAYLPPERVDGTRYDARGDIYGLGASLYLLLAGRPPFGGESPEEVLHKVRSVEPAPLASLRPTEAPELTALVMTMLSKWPQNRPQTAAEVCQALAPFCRPGTLPAAQQVSALPQAIPVSQGGQAAPAAGVGQLVAIPVTRAQASEPEPEPDAWGVNPNAFAAAQAASSADRSQPRRRQLTDADKAKSRFWIAVGLCLHLSAIGLIIAWAAGAFDATPDTPPTEPKEKRSDTPVKPKQKARKTNPDG
jgi:serine/threonine protein kinase